MKNRSFFINLVIIFVGVAFWGAIVVRQLFYSPDPRLVENTLTTAITNIAPFPGDVGEEPHISYKLSETHLERVFQSSATITNLKEYYENELQGLGWSMSKHCINPDSSELRCFNFQKDNLEAQFDFRGQSGYVTKGYLITIIYFHFK